MTIIESGRHFSMMFTGDLNNPTTVSLAVDNRYGTPKDTKFQFIFHTDTNVRNTLMKLDSLYWWSNLLRPPSIVYNRPNGETFYAPVL